MCVQPSGRILGRAKPQDPSHLLPASNLGKEAKETDQFTAKGCFFLRDTDMETEHRQYVERDVGEARGLNSDREGKAENNK